MARLNISLSNELAKKITDEADVLGKTISALITESVGQYINLREQGLDASEINDFLMYYEIINSARSVPVPFKLFDNVLDISVEGSKEKLFKLFYEAGLVVGNLVKSYAADMGTLSKFLERMKSRLPVDNIRICQNSKSWEATIVGAGYGQGSSECFAEGLRGFLEAYSMQIKSMDIKAGFVKASFQ